MDTSRVSFQLQARWYGEGSYAVLELADGSVVAFFLTIFGITSICLCFLISVCFSKGLFKSWRFCVLNSM